MRSRGRRLLLRAGLVVAAMPPTRYVLSHPDARLGEAERRLLGEALTVIGRGAGGGGGPGWG
jgi:hypothetical protein